MRIFTLPLRRFRGFTLIELLTVMAVILAGLILSVAGYVTKKGALARAQAEVQALSAGCESYKADNGTYPEMTIPPATPSVSSTSFTSNIPSDNLDPRTMGNPTTGYSGVPGSPAAYGTTSFELYVALTSDSNGTQQTVAGTKNYIPDIKPDVLGRTNPSLAVSTSNPVTYLSDPFGNSYGYSTICAFAQTCLNAGWTNPGSKSYGYNPTFDLWSTGGQLTNPYTGTGSTAPGAPGDPMLQWIRNW
jgi:prepilin-type N-terminal cleavage/methylation domain-containing protein